MDWRNRYGKKLYDAGMAGLGTVPVASTDLIAMLDALDVIRALSADDAVWEHRCSDGVGGCTAISSNLVDRVRALPAAPTTEDRT